MSLNREFLGTQDVDFANQSAFLILEADHSLEGNSPCCMTKSVTSYGRDAFRISTSFPVICLCPLVFLVLFCVIYQVALLALFPTCLKKKSKGTDDVVLNQNHFPPITIALFNIICQHFYPHICRTKLLKRKQTPPQSRGLISLFS